MADYSFRNFIDQALEAAKHDLLFKDETLPKKKGRKMARDPRAEAAMRKMYPSMFNKPRVTGRTPAERMYPSMKGIKGSVDEASTPIDMRLQRIYPSVGKK